MFNSNSMYYVQRAIRSVQQTTNMVIEKALEIDIKLVQVATLFFGCLSAYQLQRNIVAIGKWVPISLSSSAGALHFFLHNREDWEHQKIFASLAAALFALHAFNLTYNSNKYLSFAEFQFAWLLMKVQTSSRLIPNVHYTYETDDLNKEQCPICFDSLMFIKEDIGNGNHRFKRLAARPESCPEAERVHWVCNTCFKTLKQERAPQCPICRTPFGASTSEETTHSLSVLNTIELVKVIENKTKLSDLKITLVDSQSMSVCITALLALIFFNTKELGVTNYLIFNAPSLARNYAPLMNFFSNDGLCDPRKTYISGLVCSFIVYTIYTYLVSSKKLPEGGICSQLPSFSYYKTFGFFLIPSLALFESCITFKNIKFSKKEEYVLKLIPAILVIYTTFAFYKKNFSWISVKVPLSLPVKGIESANATLDCLTHNSVLEMINGPSEIAQFLAEKVTNCVKNVSWYRHEWMTRNGAPLVGSRKLHLFSSETMADNCTFKGINVYKLLTSGHRIGRVWFNSGFLEGEGWLGRWAELLLS